MSSHQCDPGSNPGVDTIMWVGFVVGSLPCCERFFSGNFGFPLSSKTNISKFQFDQESGRRRTTMWMCYMYLQIVIYLFIYNAVALITFNVKKTMISTCSTIFLCSLRIQPSLLTRSFSSEERGQTAVFAGYF